MPLSKDKAPRTSRHRQGKICRRRSQIRGHFAMISAVVGHAHGDIHSKSLKIAVKRLLGPKIFFACGALQMASPRGTCRTAQNRLPWPSPLSPSVRRVEWPSRALPADILLGWDVKICMRSPKTTCGETSKTASTFIAESRDSVVSVCSLFYADHDGMLGSA